MRGHWLSTTRRLNKHYQSGQGGTIAPPSDYLTLGEYFMGGVNISVAHGNYGHFQNTTYGQNYNPAYPYAGDFYDMPETQFRRGGDPLYDDFAVGWKMYGMRNIQDGVMNWGYNYPSSQISDQYERAYYEANIPLLYPRCDSPYGGERLYKDLGMRYVRYKFPKKYYSNAYYDHRDQIGGYQYNIIGGEYPIDTGYELTEESCANAVSVSKNVSTTSLYQTFRVKQYDSNDGTEIYNRLVTLPTAKVKSIKDAADLGEYYVEGEVLLKQGDTHAGVDTTYICRIYCFIWNNAYYVDHQAHLFDIVTGEEVFDTTAILWSLVYPNPLFPYCHRHAYIQPQTSYPTYPSYLGDLMLPVQYDNTGKVFMFEPMPARNVIITDPNNMNHNITIGPRGVTFIPGMCEGLNQLEFDLALAAWRGSH